MPIESFPPVEFALDNGLLAVGGDLHPESLRLAYSKGIFPWPVTELEDDIPWFAPAMRAVLYFSEFHLSKSLKKLYSKGPYRFKFNTSFAEVIQACAKVKRSGSEGTWITPAMIEAYKRLHEEGLAHSLECYREGRLVGGLYGVSIGKMFAGESMFHLESNASKLCLVKLVDHLKQQGVSWIDCQQLTPLFEHFGAREIPREEFMQLLQGAVRGKPLDFDSKGLDKLSL